MRCDSSSRLPSAIRTLAVRGAPAIGLAAAYGMAVAPTAERTAADGAAATRAHRSQPGWAIERARRRMTHSSSPGSSIGSSSRPDRRLADLGAERFEQGDRVLTHCNAGALATGGYGTAGGVLRAAWEEGRLARVWVDETRPLLQGARLTAWELRRAASPSGDRRRGRRR